MVSKDVAMNLRKYKMNAGSSNTKTPSRRSKSRGAAEDQLNSPKGGDGKRGKSTEECSLANQIKRQLRDLDSGIADRTSLLKMLVIRCDETDQNFTSLKHALNHG
jgi:hypothetical protein